MSLTSTDALEWFHTLLGESGTLCGADAAPYLEDWRHQYRGDVIAVLRPNAVEEVARVVQFCATNDIKIFTQGGNTGMSGGATPPAGARAVILSTRRLGAIESIDPDRATITVQAGVTIGAVQQAAAEAGMEFAPDWGARDSATVGGAIATNAGGMNVVRYGTFRSQVLGLQVVLADGEVWDGRRALIKDASGYDLKQLFIGAEGTLGVVAGAVLRLHPRLEFELTAVGALADRSRFGALLTGARRTVPGGPVAIELLPQQGVRTISQHLKVAAPLPEQGDELVLMRFAATESVDAAVEQFLEAMISDGVLLDATVADSTARSNQLWEIRDLMSSTEVFPFLDQGLKFDTAVPVDQIGPYLDEVQQIIGARASGSFVHAFGHLGDGNIHIRVAARRAADQPALDAGRTQIEAAIDRATLERGGTLSAEHGIGRAIRGRVRAQKSAIEWELMRTIKHALDPQAIFNPDIMLPLPQ